MASNLRGRAAFAWLLVILSISKPCGVASLTIVDVVPTDTPAVNYGKIQGATAGTTVRLAPGTYSFRVLLTQKATASSPIKITALNPNNPPVIDAGSKLVENLPGSSGAGDRGRGLWQLVGAANYEISYLRFKNARCSSQNSAGIRFYNTVGLYVHHCQFTSSDNGITGGNMQSQAAFEYCEFFKNGNLQASAATHNLYIYGGDFTLRYSYVHDSVQAQNFHLRCATCLLEYNWIARAASYAGDLMPSDDTDVRQSLTLRGNVIDQGTTQGNHVQLLVLYNDQGRAGWTPTMILLYNTIVIADSRTYIVHVANTGASAMYTVIFVSNVLTGPVVQVDNAAFGNASGTNNFVTKGFSVPPGLLKTVTAASPGYTTAYRPVAGSPLLNAASPATYAPPTKQFSGTATCCGWVVRPDATAIGAFSLAANSTA